MSLNDESVWPMYGHDSANTNANPHGTSLKRSPEVKKSVLDEGITPENDSAELEYQKVAPPDVPGPDGPPMSPIVDKTNLYFVFEGNLIAYDFEKETESWRVTGKPDDESGPNYLSISPCLRGNEIIVADGCSIYFVDKNSGNINDKCELYSKETSSNILTNHLEYKNLKYFDGKIYYTTRSMLYVVDYQNKTIDWRFGHTHIRNPPLVTEDKVVVWSNSQIYELDPNTGFVEWSRQRNFDEGVFHPQILYGGRVVGNVDTELVALNDSTGEIEWQYQIKGPDEAADYIPWACARKNRIVTAVLVDYADTKTSGKFSLLSLDVADGTVQWQHTYTISNTSSNNRDLQDMSVSRPMVSGNTVLVETGVTPQYLLTDGGFGTMNDSPYYTGTAGIGSGELRAFDLSSGKKQWSLNLDGRVSSLMATQERVYVGISNGTFHAITAQNSNNKTKIFNSEIRFCPHCKSNLEQFSNPRYCPDCGEKIKYD